MPAKLGKRMKKHMKGLKCKLYEWTLSKEREAAAWTKERRHFTFTTSASSGIGAKKRKKENQE